jgi:hypothetical protein
MVTPEQIEHFRRYWSYDGYVSYDAATDLWSVVGDVMFKGSSTGKLTHKFNKVTGKFDVALNGLISLEGAPSECDVCEIRSNPLTSLQHVPKCRVLRMSNCPDITSLEHLPDHLDLLHLSWYPDLPMLRCLNAKKVILAPNAYKTHLESILNDSKWAGKGKSHMLLCANAMKKQGMTLTEPGGENPFIKNAQW